MPCLPSEPVPVLYTQEAPSPSAFPSKRTRHTDRHRLGTLTAALRLRLNYARLKVLHGWHNQTFDEVENLYFLRCRKQFSTRALPLRQAARVACDLTSETDDSKESADSDTLSGRAASTASTKLTTPDMEACSDEPCSRLGLDSRAPGLTLHGTFDSSLFSSQQESPCIASCADKATPFSSDSSFLPSSPRPAPFNRSIVQPVASFASPFFCDGSDLNKFSVLHSFPTSDLVRAPAPPGHAFAPAAIWPTPAGPRTYDEFWKACSAAADIPLDEEPRWRGMTSPLGDLTSDDAHSESKPTIFGDNDISMTSPFQYRSLDAPQSGGGDSLTSLLRQPLTPLQLHVHRAPADLNRNSPSTISKAHRNRLYSAPSCLDEDINISVDDLDAMNWS